MNTSESSRLSREIDEAFAERVYPGDDNITAPTSDETSEHYSVAAFFRGRQWPEITYASIRAAGNIDLSGFFYVLTPDAFAYYLPAFLKQSLDIEAAPEWAESLQFALSPVDSDADPSIRAWQSSHLGALSEQERAVATKVYGYLDEHMD